jgi:hypothetical protein
VTVTLDSETLNELLHAVTLSEVQVPITEQRSMRVLVDELKVTGLDPAADGSRKGYITTSMKLRAPQLGLEISVDPRLSMNVIEEDSGRVLELRFEEVELPLPLGAVDIARLLPPLRYPAETISLIAGSQGDVQVRSRLAEVKMGREVLRFEFDIEVRPPDEPQP